MIGQKKRLTASAARRKHSVTAAIFDCCTLICRIGEKLAVYPSQMPRVLEQVAEWGEIVVASSAVHTIVHGYKAHITARKDKLCIMSYLQVIPAEPAQMDQPNFTILYYRL